MPHKVGFLVVIGRKKRLEYFKDLQVLAEDTVEVNSKCDYSHHIQGNQLCKLIDVDSCGLGPLLVVTHVILGYMLDNLARLGRQNWLQLVDLSLIKNLNKRLPILFMFIALLDHKSLTEKADCVSA